jgi:plasmanylethanolamine desaturase
LETESVSSLPKHDQFCWSRQLSSAVFITVATCLLIWTTVRLAMSMETSYWWMPLAVFCGMLAADFLSGLIHWSADTWGSEKMPIIGRRLLHPFRVHHVNPDDFLDRRFIDTNGDTALLVIPILLGATLIPLDGAWQYSATVSITTFGAMGMLTNQIHQWAHMQRPPLAVRTLQNCRLILRPSDHGRHHNPPFASNYCIATGWCNRPLEAIVFFQRMEQVVTWVTGLKPRHDESVFLARSKGSLAATSEASPVAAAGDIHGR